MVFCAFAPVLLMQWWGLSWYRRNLFGFELGLLLGLLASIGYTFRLRSRRELAPVWVFYLNLFSVGSFLVVMTIGFVMMFMK